MKAAVLMAPGKLEIVERPLPEIQNNQVLLKILCFGICGTDMQIYHGKHKYATFPMVMGHEVAALVERVGDAVEGFQAGDKVTIEPQIVCGECKSCRQGRFNVCQHLRVYGVYTDGCNCEYMAIEPKYLHHVPADMRDEDVALVEPVAVGVGSAKRSRLVKGGNVCVIGAGTIGNLTAQAAKQAGAKQVLVVDICQNKLDFALECGIDYALNNRGRTIKEVIHEAFGDDMADVIIDCAAVPVLFQQILQAAVPNSDIVLTGNYKQDVELSVPTIQRQEISLIGHMMYVWEDFETAIEWLHAGKIRTDKVVSQTYTLAEYPDAFPFMETHPDEVMKIIVKV